MQLIASDLTGLDSAGILDGFDYPAILVSSTYQILAANDLYTQTFGEITPGDSAYCYKVSHQYDRPCDQAGESCPLAACKKSGHREKVLHIHNTPRGREHVDVEMLPIFDKQGALSYFVELLKPVSHASAQTSKDLMVGTSPSFNKLIELINRVGPSDASVLLLGESGTGKELAAKAIHQSSPRKDKPFVTVECAGLTETLFESELFGHTKGAFTGATYSKQGLVDAANGGTLFLDEIGDIALSQQVKLLRLIETGTYRAVGSVEAQSTDFRLICATHMNLWDMVESGAFREDLYYRINVFPIHLPALRQRSSDIPLLARSILSKLHEQTPYTLSKSAEDRLMQYPFKGNVRELRNILERAVLLSNTSEIGAQLIESSMASDVGRHQEPQDLHAIEHRHLLRLLAQHDGDKSKVAQELGISLRTLYRKLRT
ncbi:MAG: sigma-54 interaction domain-containing protein [Gammaproteobacteria bacterium]